MLLLNAALLLLFSGASIAAITGDTWCRDEKIVFYKRFTRTGWIAFICIVITLVLGLAKEYVITQNENEKEAKIADQQATIDETNKLVVEQQATIDKINRLVARGSFLLDSARVNLNGEDSVVVRSDETGEPVKIKSDYIVAYEVVKPGVSTWTFERVEWTVPILNMPIRIPKQQFTYENRLTPQSPPDALSFQAGKFVVPIDQKSDKVTLLGYVGGRVDLQILNPQKEQDLAILVKIYGPRSPGEVVN